MDENNDGSLTEEEFLKGCLQDDELSKMLAPNVATQIAMDSTHRRSVQLLENSSGVEADALAIDNSVTPAKNLEKQTSWDEEPSKSVYLVIFKSG